MIIPHRPTNAAQCHGTYFFPGYKLPCNIYLIKNLSLLLTILFPDELPTSSLIRSIHVCQQLHPVHLHPKTLTISQIAKDALTVGVSGF